MERGVMTVVVFAHKTLPYPLGWCEEKALEEKCEEVYNVNP